MKKLIYLFLMLICISMVLGEPSFMPRIESTLIEKNVLYRSYDLGTHPTVTVDITNNGDTGWQKCEVGLYTQDTVKSWFGGKLPGYDITYNIATGDALTANCVTNQPMVATKYFNLVKGQMQKVDFRLYVPYEYNPADKYIVAVNCFNHCYSEDPTTFKSYGVDGLKVTVKDPIAVYVPPTNHCTDLKKDSDETDFDCGGNTCSACKLGLGCVANKDCTSNICTNNVCSNTVTPPVTPPVGSSPSWNNIFWVIVIVIAFGLVIYMLIKK